MSDAATRLFIIDQTLKDYQGHHFEYDAAIAEAAQSAGLKAVIAANRDYENRAGESCEVVPWYRASWHEAGADGDRARTFWVETLQLLQSRAATPDDIVLLHTVSFAEFSEVVDYYEGLLWCDVARLPAIYVILRRDPDEYGRAMLEPLRVKLKRICRIPDLPRRLLLCTDTEPLREAWAAALGQPVLTLPIPFRHELVDRKERRRPTAAPKQVVYLGDARNEKGYQHFPAMAQALWKDYVQPGRVELTLQSNYNMKGGESGIPQARLKLQRYPHGVTLLTEPLEPDAYYEVLAKADIIVLPYDPQCYARRSSGVLNEAVAAGKVAVAPEGTWLASQLDPSRGVVYRHPGGLADAVIAAIDNFAELSRGAAAYQPRYRSEQNARRFVQALVQHRAPVERLAAGAVLYVMDGDGITRSTGSGSVARQQMKALIALGYRVHAVFQRLYVDDWHAISDMRAWMTALREELRGYRLASIWGSQHLPFYGRAGTMSEQQVLRARNVSLDADCAYRAATAVPLGLLETLRDDPPRFALVNYVQSLDFARTLTGPKTPILAEAHDIQAYQVALRNPDGFQKSDIDLEIRSLAAARHVIALNQVEADYLSERLGRDRVSFIAQPVSDGPARLSRLAGARNLAELVQNCGAAHPSFDRARAEPAPEPNSAAYFRQAKTIDLLYVSSNHIPNLRGLEQFLQNVFYPRLFERGITLAVAGTICEELQSVEGPQVLLAHRLADLEPIYAAAKVVILPIFEGAGSAIKAVEAMARAKPVVATSFAMRGVDRTAERFPVFDDWSDFGDRILALLDSPQERLAAAQASFRLSRVNGNDGGYVRRLARAVGATLGAAGDVTIPKLPAAEAASPPDALVEWNEAIGPFNALSSDYLGFGYVAPRDIAAYAAAPLSAPVARALFEAASEAIERAGGEAPEGGCEAAYPRFLKALGADEATDDAPRMDAAEAFAPAGTDARLFAYDARGPRLLWRSADQPAGRKQATGLIRLATPHAAPGMAIEQSYDLVTAPRSGLSPCVVADGFHDAESSPGLKRRWTGPETKSTFFVSASTRYDVELVLQVHGFLAGEIYENARLEADGQPLPTLKFNHGDRSLLVALAPAAAGAARERMKIALSVPRTLAPSALRPSSDSRRLGLALGRLELRSLITSEPAFDYSLMTQALAAMGARAAPDLVYGGYRDLLGREPDPDGHAHYVNALVERTMTAAQFFADLIGSQEFVGRYPQPRLGELLNRCIAAMAPSAGDRAGAATK